ncbi:MAG: SDR family oxidoreductase [bacterium]
MKGKTVIVTGSNTGIGRVTALELARQGANVVLACRSEEKAEPVVQEIIGVTGNQDVRFMKLDLSSFGAIRDFATAFTETHDKLDVLVNNAGLAGSRGVTTDGFEIQFGVNHLGPMLLTQLLRPLIEDTAKQTGHARIVHVASRAHTRVKGIDYAVVKQKTISSTGFPEYCVSKLGNVLYNMELAEHLKGTNVHTYALHPGVVASDIWRRAPAPIQAVMKLFMVSNEEGAQTSIYCASSPDCAAESGLYYDKSRVKSTAKHATQAAAKECWEKSMEFIGL